MNKKYPKKEPPFSDGGLRGWLAHNIAHDLQIALFAEQGRDCKGSPYGNGVITSESTERYDKVFVAVPSGAMCGALQVSVHVAYNGVESGTGDTYFQVKVQKVGQNLAAYSGYFDMQPTPPSREYQVAIKDEIMGQLKTACEGMGVSADVLARRHAPLAGGGGKGVQGCLFDAYYVEAGA